jgi:3-dehydroquinate dehydratase-1
VDGIDIELNAVGILPAVVAAAHAQNKVVVISNHNFESTPTAAELDAMATRAKTLGADFVKLSATARSTDDVRTLASFTQRHADLGLIVIAMGPLGALSRVFFPALGSRLTYAHTGQHAVSGQLDFQTTFERLREFYPAFNEKKIIALQLLEDA